MQHFDVNTLRRALEALGAHVAAAGTSVSVVVVGGAALALRGWVPRTTDDVDVLAVARRAGPRPELEPPVFSGALSDAIARVARDFALPANWFNADVAMQWQTGLPETVREDVEWLRFDGLQVGLAGRQTLVTLKLFAAADSGRDSVHAQDLIALAPDDGELDAARRWVVEQDALDEFPQIVDEVISHVREHR